MRSDLMLPLTQMIIPKHHTKLIGDSSIIDITDIITSQETFGESTQVTTVQSKNFLNTALAVPKVLDGWLYPADNIIISANGVTFTSNTSFTGVLIPLTLKANTTYTIKYDSILYARTWIKERLGTTNGISVTNASANKTYSFTTNATTDYWLIIDQADVVGTVALFNMQVEEGIVATPVVPFVPDSPTPKYSSPIINTIKAGKYTIELFGKKYSFELLEDLRSVGAVKDRVYIDVRRRIVLVETNVGTKLFNGASENWIWYNSGSTDSNEIIQFLASNILTDKITPTTDWLCSHFKKLDNKDTATLGEGIFIHSSLNYVYLRIKKSVIGVIDADLATQRNAKLKTWLTTNNPIIQYPIAETKKTILPLYELEIVEDATHIFIENATNHTADITIKGKSKLVLAEQSKNKFDINKYVNCATVTGNQMALTNAQLPIAYGMKTTGFSANIQYTLSFKGYRLNTNSSAGLQIVYTDGTTVNTTITATSITNYTCVSAVGKTIDFVRLDYSSSVPVNTFYLSDIQIEQGIVVTSYDIYRSNSLISVGESGSFDFVSRNCYKNEVDYTASTWAEWSNTTTKDLTGATITNNGSFTIFARSNCNFKVSTKYVILFNIVSHTLTTETLYIGGGTGNALPAIVGTKAVGNQKQIVTSNSSITSNTFRISLGAGTVGNAIKIKDIRIYELPTGSEIETDANTKTADELAIKYPFMSKENIKSSTITIPLTLREDNGVADTLNTATGKHVKNISDWVTLDGNRNYSANGVFANSKKVYTLISNSVDGNGLCLKYNTVPLTYDAWANISDSFGIISNALRLCIANSDTGWSGSDPVIANEAKAYFNGWKMCNSDGTSPYYKSEAPYTASTWSEWAKQTNAVGDNTGLQLTANGTGWIYATINTAFKPSTKYLILYNVVESSLVNSFITTVPVFNNLSLPKTVGNQKIIATSASSISSNMFGVQVYNTEPSGNRIKIKDLRIFELPSGSQIETDANTMTMDELYAKYTFNGLCTKNWKHVTDGLGQTAILPIASYTGYTPYRMLYQLANPVIDTVSLVGQPETFNPFTDIYCEDVVPGSLETLAEVLGE